MKDGSRDTSMAIYRKAGVSEKVFNAIVTCMVRSHSILHTCKKGTGPPDAGRSNQSPHSFLEE